MTPHATDAAVATDGACESEIGMLERITATGEPHTLTAMQLRGLLAAIHRRRREDAQEIERIRSEKYEYLDRCVALESERAAARRDGERLKRIDAHANRCCESSTVDYPCGVVEYEDCAGVPLCAECWQALCDAARSPEVEG